MFQTVGHEAIDLYSKAMRLPLLRNDLDKETSINQEETYVPTQGDEVEELYKLLSRAKSELNVNAVCSGAILSDYQRVRVCHSK